MSRVWMFGERCGGKGLVGFSNGGDVGVKEKGMLRRVGIWVWFLEGSMVLLIEGGKVGEKISGFLYIDVDLRY